MAENILHFTHRRLAFIYSDEARQYQAEHGTLGFLSDKDILLFREKPLDLITVVGYNASILPIWHYNQDGERIIESESELYFPVWQTSPSFLEGDEVNENILKANHTFAVWEAYTSRSVVISEFFRETAGGLNSPYRRTAFFSLMISTEKGQKVNYTGEPISCIYFPVFTSFERNRRAGAFLSAWIRWSYYFERVLPANMQGITVVISDACGGVHTYSVNGRDVENIGEGKYCKAIFRDKSRKSISTYYLRTYLYRGLAREKLHCAKNICIICVSLHCRRRNYHGYSFQTGKVSFSS